MLINYAKLSQLLPLRSLLCQQLNVLSLRNCSHQNLQQQGLVESQFLNFSSEQIDKILQAVNNKTLSELESYEISKARAFKLSEYRQRHGSFEKLQDLLLIQGFGEKLLSKFCHSLLQPAASSEAKPSKTQKRVRTTPFITPSLDVEQKSRIRSCVALRLGVASICWSHLQLGNAESNLPCLLSDWQHHEINAKRLHLSDLVRHCLHYESLIPHADCYIFESPQTAVQGNNPGNAEQQNISIQKSQLAAIMGYALNARYKTPHIAGFEPARASGKVFYLRRFLSARLFNHLVGNERVSTEQSILNLMRTYYNIEDRAEYIVQDEQEYLQTSNGEAKHQISMRGNVHFDEAVRRYYSQATRVQKEFLGQALLLNLTFVRLVLLEDAVSLAVVTRNPNKSLELDNEV